MPEVQNRDYGNMGALHEEGATWPGRDVYVNERVTPDRQQATARLRQKGKPTKLRFATWNVNTLNQTGKLENLKQEMKRLRVDLMGVAEVRWTGVGKYTDEEVDFYYSGGENHARGVGIMVNKNIRKAVTGVWNVSDRIILIKIAGTPININVIQVYAPTTTHPDEEIEDLYEKLEEVKTQCKAHDINIIMGDINAKVGEQGDGQVSGNYGLGTRNERGERFIEWCRTNNQVIMNTWFRHHPRHRWTWRSPGGIYKNQIDYITINQRFRNSITQVKTYPGADCGIGCDHVPVVATIRLRLKKTKKKFKVTRNWETLRERRDLKAEFEVEDIKL